MAIVMSRLDLFFKCLEDKEYLEEDLRISPYFDAVRKYGDVEYSNAFGYVPLLSLGGNESVDNLDKVEIREHILIHANFMGQMDY